MKYFYPILLAIITIAFLIAIFIKATDKICDKTYSPEFKQTQQYKGMQCPESK